MLWGGEMPRQEGKMLYGTSTDWRILSSYVGGGWGDQKREKKNKNNLARPCYEFSAAQVYFAEPTMNHIISDSWLLLLLISLSRQTLLNTVHSNSTLKIVPPSASWTRPERLWCYLNCVQSADLKIPHHVISLIAWWWSHAMLPCRNAIRPHNTEHA